ncbi:MAG: hypothetical protein AB8B69_03165 [Chitinophagales bacterium]
MNRYNSLLKALSVIDITAPIFAGKAAGGIELGSTFQDLIEVIERITYRRFDEECRGFMSNFSVWYNLHNYITLEFSLLSGILTTIRLYPDYKGKYEGVIEVGQTTIEEAGLLLNKEIEFDNTFEYHKITGTEGIYFRMNQTLYNDSYPLNHVKQKIGVIAITLDSVWR